MKKRNMVALFLSIVMVFSLSACGGKSPSSTPSNNENQSASVSEGSNQTTYKWKLSFNEVAEGLQGHYSRFFKDALNELSDGRIKLELFSTGQLAEGVDQIEMAQSGMCEFVITDPGYLATMIPTIGVLSLHYLQPQSLLEADAVLTDSTILDYFTPALEAQKLTLVDFMTECYIDMTSKAPIETPENCKGLKMRTYASEIMQNAYQAYGFSTITLPASELYSALQLGMADAQSNSLRSAHLNAWYEVQDYGIRAYHDMYTAIVVANAEFFSGLPSDIQDIIMEASVIASEKYHEVQGELDSKSLAALEEAGMNLIFFTEEQQKPFKELAETVSHPQFIKKYGAEGQEIMDIYLAAKEKLGY